MSIVHFVNKKNDQSGIVKQEEHMHFKGGGLAISHVCNFLMEEGI